MAIIFEDSDKVINKKIPIPKKTKEIFKAMKDVYKPYLDMNIQGSKVMKSLGSDKTYNKKGTDSKSNGEDIKQDSITVDDAKFRLHTMEKLPKNDIRREFFGGDLGANLYRKGIEQARGVKKVDAVEPPKPTTDAEVKPSNVDTKEVETPNGTVKYTVTAESKKTVHITEDQVKTLKNGIRYNTLR